LRSGGDLGLEQREQVSRPAGELGAAQVEPVGYIKTALREADTADVADGEGAEIGLARRADRVQNVVKQRRDVLVKVTDDANVPQRRVVLRDQFQAGEHLRDAVQQIGRGDPIDGPVRPGEGAAAFDRIVRDQRGLLGDRRGRQRDRPGGRRQEGRIAEDIILRDQDRVGVTQRHAAG